VKSATGYRSAAASLQILVCCQELSVDVSVISGGRQSLPYYNIGNCGADSLLPTIIPPADQHILARIILVSLRL